MKYALPAIILVGVLLALYAMVEEPRSLQEADTKANYYPLAIGDQWTYVMAPRRYTYTSQILATRVISGITTYALSIGQSYSYLAKSPYGVYEYGSGDPDNPNMADLLSPPELMFRMPFEMGQEWEVKVIKDPTIPSNALTYKSGRVVGVEQVTVPAGTFQRCVKILIEDPRQAPADRWVDWLAPGVVKTETYINTGGRKPKITTTELVSYHLT
jgi:hypothetical protein